MPMSITPPDALCAYTSSTRVYAQMTNQTMHFISLHWKSQQVAVGFLALLLVTTHFVTLWRGFARMQGYRVFKTNHSLKSTTASRLYQAGVDKQLVMERTGHRSLDSVWSYKRTCDKQRITLSDILNRKKRCQDNPQESQLEPQSCWVQGIEESQNALDIRYSAQSAFDFNLTSCGTVNINFHHH